MTMISSESSVHFSAVLLTLLYVHYCWCCDLKGQGRSQSTSAIFVEEVANFLRNRVGMGTPVGNLSGQNLFIVQRLWSFVLPTFQRRHTSLIHHSYATNQSRENFIKMFTKSKRITIWVLCVTLLHGICKLVSYCVSDYRCIGYIICYCVSQ